MERKDRKGRRTLDLNGKLQKAVGAGFESLLTPEETEACLEMLRARNLTVHTYREEIAQQLCPKLEVFANLMEKILWRLQENSKRRRA